MSFFFQIWISDHGCVFTQKYRWFVEALELFVAYRAEANTDDHDLALSQNI